MINSMIWCNTWARCASTKPWSANVSATQCPCLTRNSGSFYMMAQENAEVIVVGGGIAGLSAAIYLGRAERDVLVIDAGQSMARWEPDVENYLGFPEGIPGEALVRRGTEQ